MSPRIKTTIAPAPPPRARLIRLRPRVWASLLGLFAVGLAVHLLWQRVEPIIARHPQYQLTAENIHITAPPPWIRSDIKADVLRDAGLAGTITVLDDWDRFTRRIKEAFEFHPWVAAVDRISRRLPSALDVELTYRRPIAAVESSDERSVSFLPIDEHAIRLPEGDLTEVERRYLPRISGVTGRPLVGDVWDDPRVVGGAKLAAALADVWQQLRLVEITATTPINSAGSDAGYAFEIVTSGGTRILWGAAPGRESLTGESAFGIKRQRLLDYAAQRGQLETIDGPEKLDVRSQLVVTPRTARRADSEAPAIR